MIFVTHPDFADHDTGVGHPERPERLTAVAEGVRRSGLGSDLRPVAPEPATTADLERVHDPGYVGALERFCRTGGGHLDADTIADVTHRNAMRHFDFDPFAHRSPEESTVGALRAQATHVDVGPAEPRKPFVPPERPLTLMDMLTKAEHPLLDEQAKAEGVAEEEEVA